MDVETGFYNAGHQSVSVSEYTKRLFNYKQMDIEASLWLMYQLCVNPKNVYSRASLHHQTKQQWARDDPGFVAILLVNLFISSLAYAVAFNNDGITEILRLVFWTILVDFLLVGGILSSFTWLVANHYLNPKAPTTADATGKLSTSPSVEWLYAFDIHCNSFFPLYIFLYVLQYLLVFVLYQENYVSLFLSNTLYIVALGYYYYITFLGFTALKFLQNTQWILIPYLGCIVLYILSVFVLPLFGIYFNATVFVINFYFGK
eukprot:TRINITY_DN2653_c0_g1_i1.p1 TRINITY_DN2653_c0_g1~~TRINITY_DN2653_c0_g1_i1.p1  ORF type:complete len:260 (-),score=42.59 TRINITY_DN2653_c0_g1_i1:19-798(-)